MDTSSTFQLLAGEKMQWTGQPRAGLLLRPADKYLIPFTAVWLSFAIFWECAVIFGGKGNAPIFFPIVGALFVAMGLRMAVGRFFVDAKHRAATRYALTDKRIIIQGPKTTDVLTLKLLPICRLTEQRDGSGTIEFSDSNPWGRGMTHIHGWPGSQAPAAFDLIPDARKVHALIQQLQAAA